MTDQAQSRTPSGSATPGRHCRIGARGAVLAAAFALGVTALNAGAQTTTAGDARVIVKLKADSRLLGVKSASASGEIERRAKVLGSRLGVDAGAGPAVAETVQVVTAAGLTSAELADRLAQEADVEYAVPDVRATIAAAPDDPLYPDGLTFTTPAAGQWYLRAPNDLYRSAIDVEGAWSVTIGSRSTVVAVLDTGVRFEHPDLLPVAIGGNLLAGYDMISDVNTANDGNGRDADASDPGDWLTTAEVTNLRSPFYGCSSSAEASSWHGTATSSLIAALTNNGTGMAGVAPSVRVLPVRVLGKCGGWTSDIIAGMRWAAGIAVPGTPANPTPARVINMSLGSSGSCIAAYQRAVDEVIAAGTVIVASAGNSGGHAVSAPANCNGVIAVTGLRHAGSKVGFSSLGPEVAISAPGGNCVNIEAGSPCLYPILAASDSGATTPSGSIYTDSYDPSVGTSFSSPLVAGTAALILSIQPSFSAREVRAVLQATARAFPTSGSDSASVPACRAPYYDSRGNAVDQLECYCNTEVCGAGMLDAAGAVALAASITPGHATDGRRLGVRNGSEFHR